MENFTSYNPTALHFGKDVLSTLGDTVNSYGKKALLVYGKGSIKENGIYNTVLQQLRLNGVMSVEYEGIKSNPVVEDVNRAALLGKENEVDVIVAVGGGSVIDSAKIIALCIPGRFDGWDVMKRKVKPLSALPIISVLTIAATGTEMNPFAVIQNHKTNEKIGFGNSLVYPKHSFLDPQHTFSVSKAYTAYGIVDLIAHSLEAYFGMGNASLSDRFVYSIIKEAIEVAPIALNEPHNYDARAKIMWAATCALNGMTLNGRKSGDWGVHDLGHTISMLYDIPHGASLSIAYPAWLRFQSNRIENRITELGKNIFGVNSAEETINQLEIFFKSLESPVRLANVGINADKAPEIIALYKQNKVTGANHQLQDDDYEKIVQLML